MDATTAGWVLDIVLLFFLLSQIVYGWRRGFLRTALWLIGIVAGGFAAVFIMPWLTTVLPDAGLRFGGALAATAVLIGVGGALGSFIGRTLGSRIGRSGGRIDQAFGGVTGLVSSVAVIILVTPAALTLGAPTLTAAINSSRVVNTLEEIIPEQLQTELRTLGASALDETLPWVVESIGGIRTAPSIPQVDLSNPALTQAAKSVVRITGAAYRCSQDQSGSGFVVAPGRVITNAHVVAGVNSPVVEAPGESAKTGRVVSYDATTDLAVIAVDGLSAAPLSLGDGLKAGGDAAFQGYPYGGPFQSQAAQVITDSSVTFTNENNRTRTDVLTLAANVQSGNSGGPLLDTSGHVEGVIFAKERGVNNVGYAISLSSLRPLVDKAGSLSSAVDSGVCTRD